MDPHASPSTVAASPIPMPTADTAGSPLQQLVNDFLQRLPYVVVALVVLLVFSVLA